MALDSSSLLGEAFPCCGYAVNFLVLLMHVPNTAPGQPHHYICPPPRPSRREQGLCLQQEMGGAAHCPVWAIRRGLLVIGAGCMLQMPVKQVKFVLTSALYVESFLGSQNPSQEAAGQGLWVSIVIIFAISCIGNPHLGLVARSSCSTTSPFEIKDQVEKENLSRFSSPSPRYVTEVILDHSVPAYPSSACNNMKDSSKTIRRTVHLKLGQFVSLKFFLSK